MLNWNNTISSILILDIFFSQNGSTVKSIFVAMHISAMDQKKQINIGISDDGSIR